MSSLFNNSKLSKIFESSTSAQQVIVPNSNLRPEYTNSFDFGLKQIIASKIEIEIQNENDLTV